MSVPIGTDAWNCPLYALARFLSDGSYDRHIRRLRRVLARQSALVREAVLRSFPRGTRVARPEGGFFLWVEMPETADAMTLYGKALKKGIALAPGPLFTTGEGFRNCMRINTSLWSERTERAVETVGKLLG